MSDDVYGVSPILNFMSIIKENNDLMTQGIDLIEKIRKGIDLYHRNTMGRCPEKITLSQDALTLLKYTMQPMMSDMNITGKVNSFMGIPIEVIKEF